MTRKVMSRRTETTLQAAHPAPHWHDLRRGERVRVLLSKGFEESGSIFDLTRDHASVWVDLDAGRGRILLHCTDGVEILAEQA
ncbi:hypothetical protein [Pseudarthrobacter sp. PS3-L1]|uniref:hypothetical protein n=1 Tax=Pseudarthrobacter sp. PS3-L1 TaxID=3046207 RepID=UPI0024BAD6F3|nr:hypothetical protein [Pseudarthrobacter sp. PS3-L1]MDJ0320837.1 hypothetical protein [Pseudarthrobacter sp. PS3-L1]